LGTSNSHIKFRKKISQFQYQIDHIEYKKYILSTNILKHFGLVFIIYNIKTPYTSMISGPNFRNLKWAHTNMTKIERESHLDT